MSLNACERAYTLTLFLCHSKQLWQRRWTNCPSTGQREPLRELIRTFWYMHIKPTLSRAGSLSKTRDQYADLITNLKDMVKKGYSESEVKSWLAYIDERTQYWLKTQIPLYIKSPTGPPEIRP